VAFSYALLEENEYPKCSSDKIDTSIRGEKKETSKKESFHNTSGSKYAYSVAEDENKIGEVQLSRNGHEKDSG
jgi:hypothetical protein